MGFIARIFTPPGSGAPPPAAAPPVAAPPPPAPAPEPPPPPTLPTAPSPPPQFRPGSAPGVAQRAAITATSFLGAGAAAGQTARKSLLGQ